MRLIYTFLALLGGFLVIGTIAAVRIDRHPEKHEYEAENIPRVIVSQKVPSVPESFKRNKN